MNQKLNAETKKEISCRVTRTLLLYVKEKNNGVLGSLLDGFPRTAAQAQAFDAMLVDMGGSVIAVPYIKVAEEILIERLDRLAPGWIEVPTATDKAAVRLLVEQLD